MKSSVSVIAIASVWAMVSCSPRVTSNIIRTFPPQESIDDVVLLKENAQLPADASWMGGIDVSGKANYDKMAEMTRFKAWESGGKYVKINSYASEGARSDIHVMHSDVYTVDTVKSVPESIVKIERGNNVGSGYPDDSRVSPVQATTPQGTMRVEPTVMELMGPHSIRVFAGYGRRLNKVDPSLSLYEKEHVKRLMNGVLLGGEYVYFFNLVKGSGVGFRYQILHGSSSDPATVTFTDGSKTEGVLTEKVNISFLGPLYSGRLVSKNGKHLFQDSFGLGLILYKDNATISDMKTIITGRNLGWTCNLSYSYMFTDNLWLGADISYTSGMLKRWTVTYGDRTETTDLDKSHYEGLVHLGICAQLVYTF